jgi:hypothetical protein
VWTGEAACTVDTTSGFNSSRASDKVAALPANEVSERTACGPSPATRCTGDATPAMQSDSGPRHRHLASMVDGSVSAPMSAEKSALALLVMTRGSVTVTSTPVATW